MSTRNCQGMDSVIKPLDTIPEDKKVRVQRTQSTFDPFEKPANQVKRVHSENNACINFKSSSTGKESPKVRRHSSPSSVSAVFTSREAEGVSVWQSWPAVPEEGKWLYQCIMMCSLSGWFSVLGGERVQSVYRLFIHKYSASKWEMIQLIFGKFFFFFFWLFPVRGFIIRDPLVFQTLRKGYWTLLFLWAIRVVLSLGNSQKMSFHS